MSGAGGILGAIGGMVGDYMQGKKAEAASRRQRNYNLNMARNQIQFRVQDAKQAGIHPLASLGITPYSGSSIMAFGGGNWSNSMGKFGQSIGDAIDKSMDKDTKLMRQIDLEKAGIDKEKARVELEKDQIELDRLKKKKNKITDSPYGQVIGGQTDSGKNGDVPFKELRPKQVTAQSSVGVEVGKVPLEQAVTTEGGGIAILPSREMAEILESSFMDKIGYIGKRFWRYWKNYGSQGFLPESSEYNTAMWTIKNGLERELSQKDKARYEYQYDVLTGKWYPMPKGKKRKLFRGEAWYKRKVKIHTR